MVVRLHCPVFIHEAMMRHKFEPDPLFGTTPRDMNAYNGRRCVRCGLVQRKLSRQSWQRVVGYYWWPETGKCVKLEWAKPEHCRQETKCGTYWVEQNPDNDYEKNWHAHHKDYDEQLTFDGFRTRADAKRYCEQHAREYKPE